jgi:hypothetical protein
MGLTSREWLTVALFVLSLVITVAGALLGRFLKRVDRHHEALYGEQGLFARISLYVKREDHDVANAELAALMEKIRQEANHREGRILDAIARQAEDRKNEERQIRGDLGKLHDRIDRLRDTQGSNPARRHS